MRGALACCVLFTAIGLIGCDTAKSPGTSTAGSTETVTIRLLVIDDPELAKSIGGQWKARAIEDELQITNAKASDLQQAKRLSADVVIFPARWMGELAERELIQPVPEAMLKPSGDEPPLIRVENLLPTVRQCDVSWGRKVYAVTLGSPQLMLLYRPDVFERLKLKRPETWQDYSAAVKSLSDRASLGDLAPSEEKPWHATLEPTAEGWAGTTLLARVAASVRTEGQLFSLFDIEDMSARIAAPPFVAAAQQMAEDLKASAEQRLTPGEVRSAFFRGECGMAITWPSATEEAGAKIRVAFAELPGSTEAYLYQSNAWSKKLPEADVGTSVCAVSGRLAAVTREARRSRAAFQFLSWLSNDETVRVLGPANLQTTLFKSSHLTTAGSWLGPGTPEEATNQFSQVAQQAFSRNVWMPVVRLPGVDDYHTALDVAVVATLNDPDQGESALQAAASKWNEITKRYDLTQQRRAYQRSLGNDY